MKSSLQASAFLCAVLSFCSAALVVPGTFTDSPDLVSVAGSTGDDHVSILLEIPCDGCLGTDDGLDLTLAVFAAETECQDEPVFLNGASIGFLGQSGHAEGDVTIPYQHNGKPMVLRGMTYLTCSENHGTFLSISIWGIDENMPVSPIGFTASFRRTDRPEVLKLQASPRFPFNTASPPPMWLGVEPEKKVSVKPDASSLPSDILAGLPVDLMNLAAIKSQLDDFKEAIEQQEENILSLWKAEFQLWKAEFSTCSSIRCYIRTIVAKAPKLARLLATHIKHQAHVGLEFLRKANKYCPGHGEKLHKQQHPSGYSLDEHDYMVHHDEAVETTTETATLTSTSVEYADDVLPTPAVGNSVDSIDETEHASEQPHGPPFWAGKRPPWAHGGRPPWAKPGSSPPWGPPPGVKPGQLPPWTQNGHHRPSFTPQSVDAQSLVPKLTPVQVWRIRFIGATVGLLVVVLFAACVFTCVRHKARFFCNPRCRAEMMARREEWRTKRLYRKAACKHRLRAFFKRLRGSIVASGDEEKESMLAPPDDALVDRQIRNLRAAHRVVGDLMRAEEGESRFTQSTRARSESLPLYTSGPPGYESGLEGSISAIDGFTVSGYTPSNTDNTPDSSVVDSNESLESSIIECSPRMSFETQRTF